MNTNKLGCCHFLLVMLVSHCQKSTKQKLFKQLIVKEKCKTFILARCYIILVYFGVLQPVGFLNMKCMYMSFEYCVFDFGFFVFFFEDFLGVCTFQ